MDTAMSHVAQAEEIEVVGDEASSEEIKLVGDETSSGSYGADAANSFVAQVEEIKLVDDEASSESELEYTGARMGETVTADFFLDMMKDFSRGKCLDKRSAYKLIVQTRELLRSLPSLVDVNVPDGRRLIVCGDIHGQFLELMYIFTLLWLPSEYIQYIFNGNLVDRGSHSVEVVLTLFALKCLSPSVIHISRGNHESRQMNKRYGFEDEVKSKLGDEFVELFAEAFCCLPLAHVINGKIFVVHGGLFSVDGVTLSDIKAIDRFCEPPDEGLMCELLWSDPQSTPGRAPSKRGVGICFGEDVTKKFLEENNLDLIVRSHEVKPKGFSIEHDGKLITVYSASKVQHIGYGGLVKFEGPDMKPRCWRYLPVNPDCYLEYWSEILSLFYYNLVTVKSKAVEGTIHI